jgi:hypothetical protein
MTLTKTVNKTVHILDNLSNRQMKHLLFASFVLGMLLGYFAPNMTWLNAVLQLSTNSIWLYKL